MKTRETIGKAKYTIDGLSIKSSDEPDRRTINIPRHSLLLIKPG